MLVPICPMCGHGMYLVGDLPNGLLIRFGCIYCDHVEDMIKKDKEQEFVL